MRETLLEMLSKYRERITIFIT